MGDIPEVPREARHLVVVVVTGPRGDDQDGMRRSGMRLSPTLLKQEFELRKQGRIVQPGRKQDVPVRHLVSGAIRPRGRLVKVAAQTEPTRQQTDQDESLGASPG